MEKPAVNELSIRQAADEKGVHPHTIRRWIAAGILPARRVGPRLIRITAADLERVGHDIPAARG